MKYFSSENVGRTFILRLDQGDDVLGSINDLIQKENISDGVVVSGIGTLDYCTLHMVMTTGYPPVEHFEKWEDKPLELASIDGIIADGIPHLHTVISDHEKAYAGHLEPGCRILYLGEVVIMELEDMNLIRVKSENGINELVKK
ncbi:MAG: DNA-binding protein [Firmicutes bacterium]|nr:DNA-binding protein [Bacillota bacterium]